MAGEDILNLIKAQKDGATPSGNPPPAPEGVNMSDASAPPSSAPMSTPEPKMGNREGAMVNVSMAMDLLEQSLPAFGSESDEGRKILTAIRTMTDIIGPKKQKTGELQNAEILQLLQNLPQAGGATPAAKAMSQAPAIPGMAQQVPPAAPPTLPGAGGPGAGGPGAGVPGLG